MEEVAAFVRTQPVRKFTKDSILVYQGEFPSKLYAIRDGFVKIYDISIDGNEQLLGLAGRFDFLPSELLFSDLRAAQYFYAAFTPVEVFVIDRSELMNHVRHDAEALYYIVQVLAAKYHGQMRHLSAVQKPKAREKIVYVLHFLASHFVSSFSVAQGADSLAFSGNPVPLPLTQQDIANLVGVTRETAAHELKLLKNEGYISYGKSAFYINEKLANLIV